MSCNGNCNGNCNGGACTAVANLQARYPVLKTGGLQAGGLQANNGLQTTMDSTDNINQCGSYRTIHIPPPTFPEKRKSANGVYCTTVNGCDPESPMAGWLTPVLISNIGAWTSGDPIEENVIFQLAYPGVITGVAFKAVTANSNGALLSPANVRFGQFSTTRLRSVFPGWGARTAGSGSVDLANLKEQDPSEIMRPITEFSAQNLIDRINPLPLPMQQLDASGDNALWTATIDHKKTVAIDILVDLYISYNGAEE